MKMCRAEYQKMFDQLCASSYEGVAGVIEVDSGKPGATVAILACTHGNEPAGLGAIRYLLSDLTLAAGKVLFVLVNQAAASAYLNAQTKQQCEAARYVDYNMNRVPDDLKKWEGSAEGARLQQLLPLLTQLDAVLDIHSTSSNAPAMLLTCDENGCSATKCPSIPFEHIIHNIPEFLSGRFIIQLCEKAELRLLAECGQHDCPEASSRAVEISLAFLAKMGLIAPPAKAAGNQTKKYDYYVKQAVRVPKGQGEFRLVQPIAPFERIEAGQLIAQSEQAELISREAGYAIMCPHTDAPLCTKEALLFLCDRD